MKISKLCLLLCSLLAVTFALAGCVDKNADNNRAAASSTTTTTSVRMTESTPETTDNGDYSAGKDGMVNDDDDENDKDSADTQRPDTSMTPSGTDNSSSTTSASVPAVSGTSLKTGKLSDDEAASASSYILKTALRNEKTGWGLGKDRDDKNRPVDAVKAEEKYSALGGRFLTSDGKICLTFDEGYENGYTASILDTLKEKNVKAVFFVTYDYCHTAPELVRRMIDEGHTVGNHTWSHPSLPDCTQKEVWSELTKLHEYVKNEFGYEMTLFRFPKGEFSERTLDDVHQLGYTSLFWSFAYADWDTSKKTDPAEALAKIEASTHSGIYLLHAVSETNAQILGSLIDFWTQQGYSVGSEL